MGTDGILDYIRWRTGRGKEIGKQLSIVIIKVCSALSSLFLFLLAASSSLLIQGNDNLLSPFFRHSIRTMVR